MRIIGIAGQAAAGPVAAPVEAVKAADSAAPAEASRALVVLEPSQSRFSHEDGRRRSAPFLAQVIANAQGLPQTRARRRATFAEAAAAYAERPQTGTRRRTMSRSV